MDERGLADWLALREPADVASRSSVVTDAVISALDGHDPIRALDLATGTGSNLRGLIDRFHGRRQHWVAVDRSSTLLDLLPARMAAWAAHRDCDVTRDADGCLITGPGIHCRIDTRRLDLGTLPATDAFGPRHLVTASALLDLVSGSWLQSLAAWCAGHGAAGLFTIAYNGRFACEPADPYDDAVRALFNQHQHSDKGLGGPAAGPEAPTAAARAFTAAGYTIRHEPSDWRLDPGQPALQTALIEGWAHAAAEFDPQRAAEIEDWLRRRLGHVNAGRSHLTVGHDDLGAWARGPSIVSDSSRAETAASARGSAS